MMLVEKTPLAVDALPIAAFRDHLRLGSGFAEDALQDPVLESFLRAAIAAVEARTGKVLIARDYEMSVEDGQAREALVLSVAPVTRIDALVSVRDGVVDAGRWRLIPDAHRPRIAPVEGALPSGALRVEFTAGFGPDWSAVPADLQQAVMMLGAHYYEYRHEVSLGAGCMPFGVTALIERYRNLRVFGAGS